MSVFEAFGYLVLLVVIPIAVVGWLIVTLVDFVKRRRLPPPPVIEIPADWASSLEAESERLKREGYTGPELDGLDADEDDEGR